jgi:hypothetical protein
MSICLLSLFCKNQNRKKQEATLLFTTRTFFAAIAFFEALATILFLLATVGINRQRAIVFEELYFFMIFKRHIQK